MVARAVPGCWDVVAPETLCRVRAIAAAEALSEVCRVEARSDLVAALPLLRRAVAGCGGAGRVMAGANRSLWPVIAPALGTAGLGEAWQACTTLREHRGDGHVGGAPGQRRQRPRGPSARGRHQGDPGRRAAGQPRLERGGVGRGRERAQRPRPAARGRAGHRRRAHAARGGGGSHRPPGRARLRRAQRRRRARTSTVRCRPAPPTSPRRACCPSPTRWGCPRARAG